ncbi:MAG: hypothetical protein JWO30_1854 [Fibrobacteres bacterium]|nr:hypothetical protein [Fibrobacterota bacterium]
MTASVRPSIVRTSLTALALLGSAWAESGVTARDPKETIQRLEQEQTGVSLTGKAISNYERAALSGDSVRMGQPTVENAAFTQAEVDLVARPSAHTQGRLLFRVHQDWSNYYEEGPNPLTARWFDFNGDLLDGHLHYAVGDYRAKHSPLTLNAPAPELIYEPEIFAQTRQTAMEEFFLGENRLPLQGLNVAYGRDSLPGNLGVESDVAVARLRTVTGSTSWLHWTDDVEKLALTSSWKLQVLKAVRFGFAQSYIYDDVAASRSKNNARALASEKLMPMPLYEDDNVNAFSLDLDGARILSGPFSVSLETEYAMSNYRSSQDTLVDTVDFVLQDKEVANLDGTALRSVLKAGYGKSGAGPFSIGLQVGYLKNEKNFVSDLAQSPTFLGRRILNSRTEVGGPSGGYNTLDALYNHRYTVDPITSLSNSEQAYVDAKYYNGTNDWYRAPFLKNSYNFYTTTKSERDALAATGALDPHVQLIFPFGAATPNRTGVTLDLNAGALSGAVEVSAVYAGVKEVEAEQIDSLTAVPADYTRMGGGLKVNIDKLAALAKPLVVSGSYLQDGRKRAAFTSRGVAVDAEDFKTAMINADVHAGIWKGLSLMAGYQSIQSNPRIDSLGARTVHPGDLRQDQWALGLECQITHGAFVTAQYGRMDFDEAVTGTKFSQDITSLTLLIAY